MSLLERVATLIRANLNDLIDRAEDPEKMIKQVILDMQNQLIQVKTQVATNFLNVSQQKFGETFQIFSTGGREFPEDAVRLLAPYRVPLM